jgi:hypothetical protein
VTFELKYQVVSHFSQFYHFLSFWTYGPTTWLNNNLFSMDTYTFIFLLYG